MKKYVISLALLIATLLSSKAFAQYQLEVAQGPGSPPILFSTPTQRGFVSNTGSDPSPPFTLRVWGSADQVFEDDEVIWQESYPGLAPTDQVEIIYDLPTPLPHDSRLLTEIVNADLFFQACIEIPGDTPLCYEVATPVFAPQPPSFTASQGSTNLGVELDFTVPTRNGEHPFEFIQLLVEERTLDTVPLTSRVETVDLANMEVLIDGQDEKAYRILLESPPSGVAAGFFMRQCFRTGDTLTRCGIDTNLDSISTVGYRRAVANATQGELNDRVIVEWPKFANNRFFNHYYVTRCELGATPSRCTSKVVPRSGDTESYEDTSVVRVSTIYIQLTLAFHAWQVTVMQTPSTKMWLNPKPHLLV